MITGSRVTKILALRAIEGALTESAKSGGETFSRREKGSLPSRLGRGIEGEGQAAEAVRERRTERRSPNRAKNVTRLPQAGPKAAPQLNPSKGADRDDNWQEF